MKEQKKYDTLLYITIYASVIYLGVIIQVFKHEGAIEFTPLKLLDTTAGMFAASHYH